MTNISYIVTIFVCNFIVFIDCNTNLYDIVFTDRFNGKIYNHQAIIYPELRGVDRRVKHIFYRFDSNQDGKLSYLEGAHLQYFTAPVGEKDLSFEGFKYLCRIIDCNPYVGLSIYQVQQTYFDYKDVLKTNLDLDYRKIIEVERTLLKRITYM